PDPHGASDEKGSRGRARGLPRRPHAEEALLRQPKLAGGRPHHPEGRVTPLLAGTALDPQLRVAPGAHLERAAPRARRAPPRIRSTLLPRPARPGRAVRAGRAEIPGDRLRHGGNDRGNRATTPRARLSRRRSPYARRGQPARAYRRASS